MTWSARSSISTASSGSSMRSRMNRAVRTLAFGGALAMLVLTAAASGSYAPAEGPYKGSVRGLRMQIEFVFTHHPSARVTHFKTIHGHTHTQYFDHVTVHDHRFSWTNPHHPNEHITAQWTGS